MKTPPNAPPTASVETVDDSKVNSSIQEWENITGEARLRNLCIAKHFILCRDI